MTLQQCYKQLYNYIHETESGSLYMGEAIDMDEIWKIILSNSEESIQGLAGFEQLLDQYSGINEETEKINSIITAVKKFSNHKLSIKERIKSANGLINFMAYFDEKSMLSVIKSFIDILRILCKQSETIPFKLIGDLCIYGNIPDTSLEKIYDYLQSLPREDLVPVSFIHGLLFSHYTGSLDESTELELDKVLSSLDNLILTLANGTPLECAAACHLECEIGSLTEEDPHMLLTEIFEPAIKLACNKDPILAKQGHRAILNLFNNRLCISYDYIIKFLDAKSQYLDLHHYYKELRELVIENDDEEEEDNKFSEFTLTEASRKKILKFLHRVIIEPTTSDEERAEALHTVSKLTTNGIDLAQNYYEEETDFAIQLVNSDKKHLYGDLSLFFILPAMFGNSYIHKQIKKVIPKLYEVAMGTMAEDKICGMIGNSLSEIAASDDFEELKGDVVLLINKLFKSTSNSNLESATMMVSCMKKKIDEHDAGQIYKCAIVAAQNCPHSTTTPWIFSCLKTLIKHFPVDEKVTLDFISNVMEGKISFLHDIPLFYHEENSEIYNYLKFAFLRFKSCIPSYSEQFVQFLVTAIDDMKLSALKPLTSMIQKQGLNKDQCKTVSRLCYKIFESLGYTYNDTLTEAARCLVAIKKVYPELLTAPALISLMKEVSDAFEDTEETFNGKLYFIYLLLCLLIEQGEQEKSEEEQDDEDPKMEIIDMLSSYLEEVEFVQKQNMSDEILNKMNIYVSKFPTSDLARYILKVMVSFLMLPKLLEFHNISQSTEKEMRSNVRKVASVNKDAVAHIFDSFPINYGTRRNLNRLLNININIHSVIKCL